MRLLWLSYCVPFFTYFPILQRLGPIVAFICTTPLQSTYVCTGERGRRTLSLPLSSDVALAASVSRRRSPGSCSSRKRYRAHSACHAMEHHLYFSPSVVKLSNKADCLVVFVPSGQSTTRASGRVTITQHWPGEVLRRIRHVALFRPSRARRDTKTPVGDLRKAFARTPCHSIDFSDVAPRGRQSDRAGTPLDPATGNRPRAAGNWQQSWSRSWSQVQV